MIQQLRVEHTKHVPQVIGIIPKHNGMQVVEVIIAIAIESNDQAVSCLTHKQLFPLDYLFIPAAAP